MRATKPLALAMMISLSGGAAAADAPNVAVLQGDIARWTGHDAADCMIYGDRYPAVDGTCYYPVDIAAKQGVHEVALIDAAGVQHLGSIEVVERGCEEMDIEIDDPSLVKPEGEDLARHQKERASVLKALEVESGEAKFAIPLSKPTTPLPEGDDDFCAKRYFNDKEEGSVHTGRDYLIGAGTAVQTIAPGRVLIAEDHFMTGNAVYVDHGGGLVSMFFHLNDLAVASGDEIAAGAKVGTVGSTGRSTGPHLHLGVRYIDQRVDPALFLGDPARMADLANPGSAKAAAELRSDMAGGGKTGAKADKDSGQKTGNDSPAADAVDEAGSNAKTDGDGMPMKDDAAMNDGKASSMAGDGPSPSGAAMRAQQAADRAEKAADRAEAAAKKAEAASGG